MGTHNFHNFTTRIKAEDPSAKRFIVSFDANSVVTVEGMDFVKVSGCGTKFHASSNSEDDWACSCDHEEFCTGGIDRCCPATYVIFSFVI